MFYRKAHVARVVYIFDHFTLIPIVRRGSKMFLQIKSKYFRILCVRSTSIIAGIFYLFFPY